MAIKDKIKAKKINYLKLFALLALIVWFSLFFLQKIDLVNADLGRFIKNGEDIFRGNLGVLKTNFYSFTYPDYPFINHHWATGAVLYPIWKIGGFFSVHLFAVILILATFFIFFKMAEDMSDFRVAFLLSIILVPLMACRREVRPEMFSYFFSAIFFFILWKNRNGSISPRWLFLLPLLEFFWVNLHIYFFLGIAILGAFILEDIILSLIKRKWQANKLLFILVLSLAATLFNPSGLSGALYPLNIYKNYGYRVFDEQSLFFFEKVKFVKDPNFFTFKVIFLLLLLSFVAAFSKKKREIPLVNVFLAAGFSFMAFYAVRNFAIFGFFTLPIMANNIKVITSEKGIDLADPQNKIAFLWICSIFAFFIFAFYSSRLPISRHRFGIGLMPGTNRSAEFFKKQGIRGPIFNDYDIGGYLIYHLSPKEGVFVDNRPEAYPASFFQKVYIPMEKKDNLWREEEKKYGFEAIFFSRSDITPWGQKFLINRIKDRDWSPVFVDRFAIIFLKNNALNKNIIDKYSIPRSYFRFK